MTGQFLGEVSEEINQKSLSEMTDLRKDLELLLQLDFLKDKYKNRFEDANKKLRNHFNLSFEAFTS